MNNTEKILAFGGLTAFGAAVEGVPAAREALSRLMAGNDVYTGKTQGAGGASIDAKRRVETADNGQHPYAAVLCCADSRVPPEHIFSCGIGDIFVIRNAGNLTAGTTEGSIQYAAEHLHVPLIVLMGHTGCGAVAAALQRESAQGALKALVENVMLNIGEETDPRLAEKKNLIAGMKALGENPVLRELYHAGKTAFAAAIYNIKTGQVHFLTA